jgi:hypothetical protein
MTVMGGRLPSASSFQAFKSSLFVQKVHQSWGTASVQHLESFSIGGLMKGQIFLI